MVPNSKTDVNINGCEYEIKAVDHKKNLITLGSIMLIKKYNKYTVFGITKFVITK